MKAPVEKKNENTAERIGENENPVERMGVQDENEKYSVQ